MLDWFGLMNELISNKKVSSQFFLGEISVHLQTFMKIAFFSPDFCNKGDGINILSFDVSL